MYKMELTMRWFGRTDKVALRDIRQCGVKGIVTALHEIPVGEVWPLEEIKERQRLIKEAGTEWSVVESLPVSEDIKQRKGDYKRHLANYRTSIQNLAECGLFVITYNFMPVLDWVRTHHSHFNPDGTQTLLYDQRAFTFFDVFLLKRSGSTDDYSQEELHRARAYGEGLSDIDKRLLFRNILLGLPGSTKDFTAPEILRMLDNYKNLDDRKLRQNLIHFLNEVIPTAEKVGSKLAIHPDDPPFSVMGLPRIVSNEGQLKQLFQEVPSSANGLCYCTGSLGADANNDLLRILDDHGDRIHFLHLRNVRRPNKEVFMESEHLDGDNPIAPIMEKLIGLMKKRGQPLPVRPDHGFLHSMESHLATYPGYSLMGRMKGLAELRGLEMGISHMIESQT
tara:strand:+ start:140798 stop:141976 length:1179 start_codon:yes stop_codon:yes gene_type:complete